MDEPDEVILVLLSSISAEAGKPTVEERTAPACAPTVSAVVE
jgi:hypothetical protein